MCREDLPATMDIRTNGEICVSIMPYLASKNIPEHTRDLIRSVFFYIKDIDMAGHGDLGTPYKFKFINL